MGNPFTEETNDLLRLENRDILSPDVTESIAKAQEVGRQQYSAYVS